MLKSLIKIKMLSNKEKQNLKIKYYRTKYSDIQKAKRIKDLILKRIPFDIIIQDPELIPACWFWKTPELLEITSNIPLELKEKIKNQKFKIFRFLMIKFMFFTSIKFKFIK